MTPYNTFLLLVFCTTSTARSYSQLWAPSSHGSSGSKGLPQLADVHKRQADSHVCDEVVGTEVCTSGYYEDYAYLSFRCNSKKFAIDLQDVCRTNLMGGVCASFQPDEQIFHGACSSPTTCTPECRDLLTTTRDQLGCCVNILNDSDILDVFREPFRSLWSLCGVDPVTEQCAASFDLPTEIDPTCNSTSLQVLYSRVVCRAEFVDSIDNALEAAEGCQDVALSTREKARSLCMVNERGLYCRAVEIDMNSQRSAAFANCGDRDDDMCDSLCIRTLNDIANTTGCCFTDRFSDNFWQQCGLASPGSCEVRFTSGPRISNAVTLQPPGKTVTSAVGLLMIFLMFQY